LPIAENIATSENVGNVGAIVPAHRTEYRQGGETPELIGKIGNMGEAIAIDLKPNCITRRTPSLKEISFLTRRGN
jgi:hypothetical protein